MEGVEWYGVPEGETPLLLLEWLMEHQEWSAQEWYPSTWHASC